MNIGAAIRRGLTLLGWVMFALGAVLFMAPLLVGGGHVPLRAVPFPLSDAQSIAVGPSGEFFVGENVSRRVQVYDRNGHFLRGWPISGAGNATEVVVLGDTVLVLTIKHHWQRFDTIGNLLGIELTGEYPYNPIVDTTRPGVWLEGREVRVIDSAGKSQPPVTLDDPLSFLSMDFSLYLVMIGTLIRLAVRAYRPRVTLR